MDLNLEGALPKHDFHQPLDGGFRPLQPFIPHFHNAFRVSNPHYKCGIHPLHPPKKPTVIPHNIQKEAKLFIRKECSCHLHSPLDLQVLTEKGFFIARELVDINSGQGERFTALAVMAGYPHVRRTCHRRLGGVLLRTLLIPSTRRA